MKKIGYFFLCFLPVVIAIVLQIILTIPAMGICLIKILISIKASGQPIEIDTIISQLLASVSSPTFTSSVSIAFALCSILIFGFWYIHQFNGNLKQPLKDYANVPLLIGLVLLVPGLQLMSSLLTGVTASFFPSWLDYYQKLMESAGFGSKPSILLILYAVLLGPVGEELTFRGVVFSSAKKALPFWAANILQAFLFGVFHLNMIQGIYAFFIGLFLGYICGRGDSIYLSIFLHILFNAWGTLIPTDNPLLSNPTFTLVFFFVSIVLGVVGLRLFKKNSGL